MSEKNLSDGETPIIFEQLLNSFQALDTVMVKLIPSDEMKPLVLYFPGDIQDNENTIELEWKEYCLENTLNLLFSRFNQIRKTNICIVRYKQNFFVVSFLILFKTFSFSWTVQ